MVMLRCSLNGERANFGSTGIGVDPKSWDCTKSRVRGRNSEALSTNLQLSNLEDLVTSIYYKYEKTDKFKVWGMGRVQMGDDNGLPNNGGHGLRHS